MPTRKASAVWHGDLKSGDGKIEVESGTFAAKYSFTSRFEEGSGTNPEELIGAAHAGCFSMALSHLLTEEGYKPENISTSAKVKIQQAGEGFEIPSIELETEAKVPDISVQDFQEIAAKAKSGCPVSKALAGVDITLLAKLL